MKHGEQLAPLIEQALRQAGVVRQDLTALAVGVGPGPFTGLRVGLVTARTLGVRARDPGVRRVLARRARRSRPSTTGAVERRVRGGDRRAAQGGLPGGVRRARAPALDGPVVDKPAALAPTCPVVGRGRACSTPTRSRDRVGPAAPGAGWLARAVADERVELRDPEPLYLRRPDAVDARRAEAVS